MSAHAGRETMRRTEVDRLVEAIERAYDRRSWHGTNLRGSIRGMLPEEAAWRPAPGRHNAWEIVVHAGYWKYAVRRRLVGDRRGSFPLKGSNWFERSDAANTRLWREDLALLDRMHAELCSAVSALSARDLDRAATGGTTSVFELVAGIAAHDVYHAGQIQLIKRLRRFQVG
jgi:DinB superfamily